MSYITTHVLDTSRGRPAAGVLVLLERLGDTGWRDVGRAETDADGRVRSLGPDASAGPGVYRLTFDTQRYFAKASSQTFYPSVVITFETTAGEGHYHVPLLVSPFGYSTYRGS